MSSRERSLFVLHPILSRAPRGWGRRTRCGAHIPGGSKESARKVRSPEIASKNPPGLY